MIELIRSSEWIQIGLFVFIIYLGIGIKNLLSGLFNKDYDYEYDDDDDDDEPATEILDGMTVDGVKNMMSSYERTITRLRNKSNFYRTRLEVRNAQSAKLNGYLNELRDSGRITKDELEVYFKK